MSTLPAMAWGSRPTSASIRLDSIVTIRRIDEQAIDLATSDSLFRAFCARTTLVDGSPPGGGQRISGGYFTILNPLGIEAAQGAPIVPVTIRIVLEKTAFGEPAMMKAPPLPAPVTQRDGSLVTAPWPRKSGLVQAQARWSAHLTWNEGRDSCSISGSGWTSYIKEDRIDRASAVHVANRRALWDLAAETGIELNRRFRLGLKRKDARLSEQQFYRLVDGP